MSEYHPNRRGVSSRGRRRSPHNGAAAQPGVSRRWTWVRLAVVGFAYLVRVAGLATQGLWRDEVDQWRFAFEPLRDLMANFTRPGWNGPLYSPLLRGWIALTGESVFAMRYSSVLWGVLGVAVAYVLATRFARSVPRMWAGTLPGAVRRAPHWVGGTLALLIAGAPYFVYYAQEIKMYTWVPLLVGLALYALDRATRRPVWWAWLGAWLAITLAFYSHILAALLIPVAAVWFLLHPSRRRRPWAAALLTFAGLTLPYLPLLRWQTGIVLVSRETGYPRYSLSGMVHVLLNVWSTGVWQGGWEREPAQLLMMSLFGALACLGLAGLLLSRYLKPAVRLLTWLVLPLLAVWFVSLWGPIFTDRYMIWTAPAFYLLASLGVVWLYCHLGRISLIVLLGLLVIDVHGIVAQATYPLKPEYPKVVRSVEARRQPSDLLLFQIPYNHYVYDFYADDGLGAWREAPYTNRRTSDGSYEMDERELARAMVELVDGYDRVWLIYSEASLWDDRQLVKGWLDATWERLDAQSFHGVELFLYRRPPG